MKRALIFHPDELKTVLKILGNMTRPQMRCIGRLDIYEEELAVMLCQRLMEEYPDTFGKDH